MQKILGPIIRFFHRVKDSIPAKSLIVIIPLLIISIMVMISSSSKNVEIKKLKEEATKSRIELAEETENLQTCRTEKNGLANNLVDEIEKGVECTESLNANDELTVALTEMLMVMGNGLKDLDAILQKDSTENVMMINWFYANARFNDDEMPRAMKEYNSWLKHNRKMMEEYDIIDKSLNNSLIFYSNLLEEFNLKNN